LPLRTGAREWLSAIQRPAPGDRRVREVALNRDSTGIVTNGTNTVEALLRGVRGGFSFLPILANAANYRTCLGSSWLRDHRADLIMDTIIDSEMGGEPGFTM